MGAVDSIGLGATGSHGWSLEGSCKRPSPWEQELIPLSEVEAPWPVNFQ